MNLNLAAWKMLELREIAEREGVPVPALIRRLIDERIETERKLKTLRSDQILVRRSG